MYVNFATLCQPEYYIWLATTRQKCGSVYVEHFSGELTLCDVFMNGKPSSTKSTYWKWTIFRSIVCRHFIGTLGSIIVRSRPHIVFIPSRCTQLAEYLGHKSKKTSARDPASHRTVNRRLCRSISPARANRLLVLLLHTIIIATSEHHHAIDSVVFFCCCINALWIAL